MALFRRHHSSALPAEQARWTPRWPGAASASPVLVGELAAMTAPATYAGDLPVRLLLEGAAAATEDELVLPAALWERIGDLARAYWLSVARLVVDPGPTHASPAWDLVIFNRAERSAADMEIEARFLAEMVADPLLRRYLAALASLLCRWSSGAAERLVVATVGADTPERTIESFRAHYLS